MASSQPNPSGERVHDQSSIDALLNAIGAERRSDLVSPHMSAEIHLAWKRKTDDEVLHMLSMRVERKSPR